MKKFGDLLTQTRWGLICSGTYLAVFLVFRPTYSDALLFLGLDILLTFFFFILVNRLFLIFFPIYTSLHHNDEILGTVEIRKMAAPNQFWDVLTEYPGRRGACVASFWFLKQLPGILLILFSWPHGSYASAAASMAVIALGSNFYVYSAHYIGNYALISRHLMEKVRHYEIEFSLWIAKKSEQIRLEILGEIASLVIHDLSSPLHVVKFCADQIKADPVQAVNPKYQTHLSTNVDRCVELVNSLRAYLRSQAADSPSLATANVGDAFMAVRRLLEMQFAERGFSQINFLFSDTLAELELAIPQPDLVHILFNLLAYNMENLLSHLPGRKHISAGVAENIADQTTLAIFITDNGLSLTQQQFDEMTGFANIGDDVPDARENLDLRLVRRLAERHGCRLKIADHQDEGTTFLFIVPSELVRG